MILLVKNIVLYIKHFKYLFSQITVTSKKTMHERFRWTIHQFDIRFPIKDEQQVVESMTSHLDKHPKIRLVVLGNERFNLLVK